VIRPHVGSFECLARAAIPTRHGEFDAYVFSDEHVALVHGQLRGKKGALVRVHSECLTSEVFGSLKCDCKEQLDAAMAAIARAGEGAILYLRQEGRGIGLDDARKYDVARDMLQHLGVESVRIMTNNPDKVDALRDLGVQVVGRVPVVVPANPHSARYLEAKRLRMEHDLPAVLRAASGDAE
jgi:GTP cyclohydrolase II